jgi:pyridoxamine 5'-phosphate oxidase
MTIEDAKQKALALIKKSEVVVLSTIDEEGYPNMRVLLNLERDGLNTIWFSTNSPSEKVKQIAKNEKAGAYFFDAAAFQGLRLTGDIKIRQDQEAREKLWRPGFEKYYPQGVTDPDYCVLELKVKKGNYYEGFEKVEFEIN